MSERADYIKESQQSLGLHTDKDIEQARALLMNFKTWYDAEGPKELNCAELADVYLNRPYTTITTTEYKRVYFGPSLDNDGTTEMILTNEQDGPQARIGMHTEDLVWLKGLVDEELEKAPDSEREPGPNRNHENK